MEKMSWQSERGSKILLDSLQEGFFVIEEGTLVYVNDYLAAMMGYEVSDLIGRPFIECIANEDRTFVWEAHRARLVGQDSPGQYDIHLVTAQGALIFCALSVNLWLGQQGQIATIGSVRNVTQKEAELAALEASHVELKSIYDEIPDIFYRTDMQGVITMISPSCYDIIGYAQNELLGTQMSSYYETPADRARVVQAITDGGGKAIRVEAALRHKNGSIAWISTNAFVRLDAQRQPVSIDGVARDITERKQLEDSLTMLSRTDGLTGVCNRRYFYEKSEEMIKLMQRYQRPSSVMIADLDHFKKINDEYGHAIGDLALIAFVGACRQEIREQDILGRLGGEEFCLLLPETEIDNAEILAERIRKAVAAIVIPVGARTISMTVSIGLAEIGRGGELLDSTMHRADQAMYQAKERGRNQVVVALV